MWLRDAYINVDNDKIYINIKQKKYQGRFFFLNCFRSVISEYGILMQTTINGSVSMRYNSNNSDQIRVSHFAFMQLSSGLYNLPCDCFKCILQKSFYLVKRLQTAFLRFFFKVRGFPCLFKMLDGVNSNTGRSA